MNLADAPAGLSNLVNQPGRIYGYAVNAERRFFYVGDTAAFEDFLKRYAAIKRREPYPDSGPWNIFFKRYAEIRGIVRHRLTIHDGRGEAKIPWDKVKGQPCDWMLEVAPESWRKFADEAAKAQRPEKASPAAWHAFGGTKPTSGGERKYIAEVHVWTQEKVDVDKMRVPRGVEVVRESPKADNAKADKSIRLTRPQPTAIITLIYRDQ